jgi:hypothetical protein
MSITRTPVPSSGCTSPPGASVTNELQGLFVNGTARWYLLTTPSPGGLGAPGEGVVSRSSGPSR